MEYLTELGYSGLFLAAFLAATILPLSSEIVLASLLVGGAPASTVVAVATCGNVLGSLTNYILGYWASKALLQKWLRMSDREFEQAEQRFRRFGTASLLFAWVPVIGDPLTVVAGVLRIRLLWFLLLVTAGKLLRYAVIAHLTLQAL
ncbi:YqaA family protein [Pseudomaricurvus sp. HS19]|uniref:YqaA family protein n=1 Tax=Pseudomaricurvus sp. HS19 TaxID=2692626 RepID=UPI00136DC5AC|nr:YqaA family protein [Pseudomaricurvus sp. HS19]MYM64532.1 DedA family protein [Pseudomaricurvus sp. HS19]